MVNGPLGRKLRMGIIGGGALSFIGKVHRTAAQLDLRAELVAGAFSSDPAKSIAAGRQLALNPARVYATWTEMLDAERRLPADKRIDFVTVATPNDTHFQLAGSALAAGFHVVCDKPMTNGIAEAEQLAEQVARSGRVFLLTHNYTGYPQVRLARQLIESGELGEIQAVRVHYLQGWMRSRPPGQVYPRGNWKYEAGRAGVSGTFGDVGSHAYHLARFVTQIRPTRVSATLRAFSPGGALDDYGVAVLRDDRAIITVTASQVTHGRANDLTLEVDGVLGSLVWRQEQPDELTLMRNGRPRELLTRAGGGADAAERFTRLPPGLPEGFIEAFANLYNAAFDKMAGGQSATFPDERDGVEGVRFIHQVVASSAEQGRWLPL
ncbi:MAG: Gfo/Idh/MocA family oxidoreductase [Pirellulaceae bacterium]|jgi:predicted dehydrogenase|nr:Gfo/Idh/MocA family oxidoreductase [Pirellulaceae bacterium]